MMFVAAILTSVPSLVNAGTTTWEWNLKPGTTGHSLASGCGQCATSGFSVTDTVGGDNVTAGFNGFSDTKNGNGAGVGNNDGNDKKIESGDLRYYGNSGWGIQNKDEDSSQPEHAFDNRSGRDRTETGHTHK